MASLPGEKKWHPSLAGVETHLAGCVSEQCGAGGLLNYWAFSPLVGAVASKGSPALVLISLRATCLAICSAPQPQRDGPTETNAVQRRELAQIIRAHVGIYLACFALEDLETIIPWGRGGRWRGWTSALLCGHQNCSNSKAVLN